jgi:transketolase
MKLNKKTITVLQKEAKEIRRTVLQMIVSATASHVAPSYSIVEILVYLYGHILRINPKRPLDKNRDRFLLSKGWGISALYAVLAAKGFFPKEYLKEYCRDGSKLIGIATYNGTPGIEASTGSIGHGLPLGVGMALGMRLQNIKRKVYVLMGDGECDEGTTLESALIAAHHHLSNLVAIIDYNKWQSFGRTNEVLNLEPLTDKWKAFGWNVIEMNGHNFQEIAKGFFEMTKEKNKPTMLIAHTIKGKGLSIIEDNNDYHYKTPREKELKVAHEEGLL